MFVLLNVSVVGSQAPTHDWDVRGYWALGVFLAAAVGSLLPFGIQKHFANVTDRVLAICTALAGGVCASVAIYLCQEGVRQLEGAWGTVMANKLGPCATVSAYFFMHSVDFFGRYIKAPPRDTLRRPSFENGATGLAVAQPHLETKKDANVTPPLALTEPLLLNSLENNRHDIASHGESLSPPQNPICSLSDDMAGFPEPTPRSLFKDRAHHHRCKTLPKGAPYLFYESISAVTQSDESSSSSSSSLSTAQDPEIASSLITRSRNSPKQPKPFELVANQDNNAPVELRDELRSGCVESKEAHVNKTTSAESPSTGSGADPSHCDGPTECPACCCESDEEVCLDACAERPAKCSHALGLHPLQLSKPATVALTRAFQDLSTQTAQSDHFSGGTHLDVSLDSHCCGGHRCHVVPILCRGTSSPDEGLDNDGTIGPSPLPGLTLQTASPLALVGVCPNYGASAGVPVPDLSASSEGTQKVVLAGRTVSLAQSFVPRRDGCGSHKNRDPDVQKTPVRYRLLTGVSFEQPTSPPDVPVAQASSSVPTSGETGLSHAFVSLLLFFCFSIHSLVEGIGLGSTTEITTLGIGIALHKSLAGFAVGASLLEARLRLPSFLLAVFTFSFMTPLGTLVGGVISAYDRQQALRGFCTAVAGGTFLFISISELIPRAFRRTHDQLIKLFAVLVGAALIILSEFCI